MGIELLEIGVKMRKGVIFTIRGFFKFVCNHPFLVVMLCFLLFLQRWFPFIFSLLVSASPVFMCTALLLGTLLSYGQPNIPEIKLEEKTFHESVSLKTGVSVNTTVNEENDGFYVDRYNEKKRDEKEQSNEQPSEVNRGYSSDDSASFIEEKSHETNLEKNEFWEENRVLHDNRYKQKAEWNEERLSDGEVLETHYASIPKVNKEHFETDDERSVDSFDSERVNVDTLDSPPRSPWKRVEEREEKVENEENFSNALDSESDGAESSSPDASMADIMPMLDELHPLLDEDAPQNAHMTIDGSSKSASEVSSVSSLRSHDSDEETENQEDDLEVAEDDNEDEDEEEEQGEKEEQTKSAITWTEEDQKNLMDLGSSELERNQRLENLILRRRGRKFTSMVPEINLIDLEISDHPYNIAPILTTRQNPFDVPQDSYNNSGLPPIPGSAPSVLLQRRNPFDIPYDTSEEKPNLVGDGIQEDFTTVQSREPFFRRHESFNVGPSMFAPNRQQDVKLRPYFVPERMVSEESSYSPFQRQSSELSDSKVSSVPETESVGSVEDLEDRKLIDEDSPLELEVIPTINEVVTEEGATSANPEPIPKKEEEEVTEDELPNEPEHISKIEHVSEDVGHGSQSESEEEEKSDIEVDELESYYEEGNAAVETEATGYSTDSSSSSVSEVSERVFTEGSSVLERGRDANEELGPGLSTRTSLESLDLRITNAVVDDIKEPVYDSSPPAVRKNLSSSSISSDVPVDSDLNLPPVFGKRTVSFIERESEGSSNIEMLPGSYTLDPVDNHESQPIDIVSTRDHDNVEEQHTQEDVPASISGQNTQGNAKLFSDDKPMLESTSNHLNIVQAHNSQAESLNEVRTIPEPNMPEVQEIDHENLSNANSPLSPDFISMPTIASESASTHLDMEKIVEEADELSVRDFIVKGSVSNDLEKHVDFVEGSSSAAHDAENSTNTKEQVSDSRNLREEIDMHAEDTESISELQSSDICIAEHIDISKNEFNERDGQDSPDQSLSEEDTPTKKNETSFVVNRNFDDNNNGIPKIEANSSVEVDFLSKKTQLELVTKETVTRNTDDDKLHKTRDILEVRSVDDATLDIDQVKKDKVVSSVENESTAKETSIIAAEKLDDKAKAHENLHSTKSGKGKGKKSKSSSSSSSSSSESSSSDSEKD